MSYIEKCRPHNGRLVREDDTTFNAADFMAQQPVSIGRGHYDGAGPISAYGERTSAGAETDFPVWPNGAIAIAPAGGVQMSIVSTSANDAAAGTHVRQVEIHYLRDDLSYDEEFITMNGTTPVLTVATDIRFVQCMHIHTIGTTPSADGVITASNGGNTYSQISEGSNRCSSSYRMVPFGKKLFIDAAVGSSISGTAAARTQLRMVASEIDGVQYNDPLILFPQSAIGLQDNSISAQFPPYMSFKAGTLVGCTHTSDKAATLSCTWFGRLEPV